MVRNSKTLLISFILIQSLLFWGCSSSSYYERYGSTIPKNENTKNIISIKIVEEDESSTSYLSASENESESIFNKLSYIVDSNQKKERFLKEIVNFLNTPYKYGGETKYGIDCSAFTQQVYKNSLNVVIPRTAREQYKNWFVFENEKMLKFGDLIYFDTSKQFFPGHVGIYLDDNLFAHSSSTNGVIISSLNNNYYKNRFIGANRIKIKK